MELNLTRLKRFDPTKHAQLEGLLQWVELMGLTGKDLISLGGHINRQQEAAEIRQNQAIVDGIGCQPIGKDKKDNMIYRWKYQQGDTWFHFEDVGGYQGGVKITNTRTKVTKKFRPTSYPLGRRSYRWALRYNTMLDIVKGKILLDF